MAFIVGCSPQPTSPLLHDINYTLWFPWPGGDSLHVRISIERWKEGDSVRLIFPPIYADNPMLATNGNIMRNLRWGSSKGIDVSIRNDTVQVGNYSSYSAAFSCCDLPLWLEYDVILSFVDSLTHGMAVPRLDAESGFITGAYLFAIPYTVVDPVRIWRDRWDLAVTYHLGSSWTMYGFPQPKTVCATPYELLFTMLALFPEHDTSGCVLGYGVGGEQPFRFVSISGSGHLFSEAIISDAIADFSVLLSDIVSVFGALTPMPLTVVFGTGMNGGLEGTFAFTMLDPFNNDTLGVFNTVAAHEAVHFWVGIRTGDEDLPWWKEGTTTYLGYLFAARNGQCRLSYLEEGLLQNLDAVPAVRQYALNDPIVRSNLYAPESGFYELVYFKGAQVTMLIDRAVRVASKNKVSIDKIVGCLCAEHRSQSFTRYQYVELIRRLGGVDVEPILSRYADTPGAIAESVLLESYGELAAFGAFGPQTLAKTRPLRLSEPKTLPPFVPTRVK